MARGKGISMNVQIVKDDDREWRKIEKEIDEPGAGAVYIGVLQEEGSGDGKNDLAGIATVHEFGASIQGTAFGDIIIPARPFIRSTLDMEENNIYRLAELLWGKVLDGDMTKREALSRVGILIQGKIKRRIQLLRDPPNSPVTIALKGSDNPLIDKGILVNAIQWVVRSK